MMAKRSLGWYVVAGLLIGFVGGIFGRSMSMQWLVPLVIALGGVVLFMYADRMKSSNGNISGPSGGSKEGGSRGEEDVQILNPDEAREWLDDFLVKQQSKDRG